MILNANWYPPSQVAKGENMISSLKDKLDISSQQLLEQVCVPVTRDSLLIVNILLVVPFAAMMRIVLK